MATKIKLFVIILDAYIPNSPELTLKVHMEGIKMYIFLCLTILLSRKSRVQIYFYCFIEITWKSAFILEVIAMRTYSG